MGGFSSPGRAFVHCFQWGKHGSIIQRGGRRRKHRYPPPQTHTPKAEGSLLKGLAAFILAVHSLLS